MFEKACMRHICGGVRRWGMDVQGGSFFNVYHKNTRVSFWRHKDEIIKPNMYRCDQKVRCDSSINKCDIDSQGFHSKISQM